MQSFRFSPPQHIALEGACQLIIKPADGISDLLLLEATNAALCECIVTSGDTNDNGIEPMGLAIRMHPCFCLSVASADAVTPLDNLEISAKQKPTQRTLGQGCRLYQALRVSKTACIAALKRGISISIVPQPNGVQFAMHAPLLNLICLEHDSYLHNEPEVVLNAKAVLNHPFDYTAAPNQLLLELSELVQASEALSVFAAQTALQQVPSLIQTLSKLQRLLEAKRKLVYRQYCTAVERANLAHSANTVFSSLDAQRLAMYQMLASDELTSLVNSMVGDELNTRVAE